MELKKEQFKELLEEYSFNITEQDGGWIGGIIGGAIRTVKKNISCGCNSGKNLTD